MASPKQPSAAQMKKALTQFRKGTKVKERVYHGTSNLEGLASFDPKLTGKGADQLGSGFYFTTHPDEASGYASMPEHPSYPKPGSGTSPGVVAAHLAIRKPIKIGPKGSSLMDASVNLSPDEVRRIMEHAPNIRHPEESPLNDHFDTSQGVTPRMISDVAKLYAGKGTLHMLENDMFRGDPTSYRHALRNVLGYDGVMKDFGDGRKHYVAWFPEQVKSAIGNRGTYDPTNPDITMAQGGAVNAFDYENPEHVENVANIAAKHPDFSKIPDVGKHLAGSLSQGGYKFIEDPRIQSAIKKAGHTGYFVREKSGKQQHVIRKAAGGVVPSIDQMKNALADQTRFKGLSALTSVGANEAPSLGVKAYIPPVGRPDNNMMPVGGVDTSQGDLPVGGIDMSSQQPGKQMMPTPPGQQPGMDQVPQGDQTNVMDGTGTPPGPNTNPPPGMPGGSSILQLTPQGQAMAAMKPQGLKQGGTAHFDKGGMASTVDEMRAALANKYNPAAIKASEALGKHEGKTLKVTQADRTKVGEGFLGGPGFSSLQHVDPRYENAAWGVNSAAAASKLANASGKDVLWSALLGSPNQHTSNQMVFDLLLKQFKSAIKSGKMTPELRAKINQQLAMAVDNKGAPLFAQNADISSKNFFKNLKTFDQRRVMADLMGGNKVGGKKGQLFDYDAIVRNTTEPGLVDAPTHAVGPRLFTVTGERSFKPDLHPAFPHILHGEDLGTVYHPVPREVMLPDFHEHIRKTKGRGVGFMDLTRNTPAQFLSEKFLTSLQKQGHKKGGKVKLHTDQDTMALELSRKTKAK